MTFIQGVTLIFTSLAWIAGAATTLTLLWKFGGRYLFIKLQTRINEPNTAKFDLLVEQHGVLLNTQNIILEKLDSLMDSNEYNTLAQKVSMNENGIMFFKADERGNTIEVSDTTVKTLKLSEKELLGRDWMSRIRKSELPGVVEKFTYAVENGITFLADFHIRCGDNSELYLLANVHLSQSKKYWFGIHTILQEPLQNTG